MLINKIAYNLSIYLHISFLILDWTRSDTITSCCKRIDQYAIGYRRVSATSKFILFLYSNTLLTNEPVLFLLICPENWLDNVEKHRKARHISKFAIMRHHFYHLGLCEQTIYKARIFFLLRITQYIGDTHNAHTRNPMNTRANPTPRSIFKNWADKSSRSTKSPWAPHCWLQRCLPLKAQLPWNPEKFAPTGNRTQDLRCYRSSCNR
jgi:hypothetical protein